MAMALVYHASARLSSPRNDETHQPGETRRATPRPPPEMADGDYRRRMGEIVVERGTPGAFHRQMACPRPRGWVGKLARSLLLARETRGTEPRSKAPKQGPCHPPPPAHLHRPGDPPGPTPRPAHPRPAGGDDDPPAGRRRRVGPRRAAGSGGGRRASKLHASGPAGQRARALLSSCVRCFTARAVPAAENARPTATFGRLSGRAFPCRETPGRGHSPRPPIQGPWNLRGTPSPGTASWHGSCYARAPRVVVQRRPALRVGGRRLQASTNHTPSSLAILFRVRGKERGGYSNLGPCRVVQSSVARPRRPAPRPPVEETPTTPHATHEARRLGRPDVLLPAPAPLVPDHARPRAVGYGRVGREVLPSRGRGWSGTATKSLVRVLGYSEGSKEDERESRWLGVVSAPRWLALGARGDCARWRGVVH
jgi:hypothetical protein